MLLMPDKCHVQYTISILYLNLANSPMRTTAQIWLGSSLFSQNWCQVRSTRAAIICLYCSIVLVWGSSIILWYFLFNCVLVKRDGNVELPEIQSSCLWNTVLKLGSEQHGALNICEYAVYILRWCVFNTCIRKDLLVLWLSTSDEAVDKLMGKILSEKKNLLEERRITILINTAHTNTAAVCQST